MAAKGRRRSKARKAASTNEAFSTLTEDAYRVIKWHITTVQLAPGSNFTESEVAERLSLSRTPVREALLLLRTEGLVTVEGRAGYKVSPITLRDVHDLAVVRRLIEGEAAFMAASRFNEPGLRETLAERIPPPLDSDEPSSVARWIETDRRFHVALGAAAGNRQLSEALEPVLEKSARHLHLVLALASSAASVTHSHDGLLAALDSRDRVQARQMVVDQVRGIEDAVAHALTSSHSLLTANVVVDKPNNQFYLDVSPAELTRQDGKNPQVPTGRVGIRGQRTKSRVGV